ncbi:MAG: tRNA dihydrouridine synthase DusB [Deltaproteobacteria bacterium]|nr:tRNA dihydrouridine synthase DusB [Deltaproteobacteria bacterium]
MKIGDVALANPLILAPMAGITQLPLRRLAKEQGCALVVSEMISANGLVRKGRKTLELLESHPSEQPLCVQIFGKEPRVMADAAQIARAHGAAMVDINLGCSVRKVVRQGAGAALMRDLHGLAELLCAVRRAVNVPVTVKMRSGWDPSGDQAVAVGRLAQDLGMDAVTIHPRTAVQGFSGKADWSVIARLKESLSIVVIGNGDLRSPQDVVDMQQKTGCDAMMIGRAAMGNPWIFSQTLDLMNGRTPKAPTLSSRLETMLRYLHHGVEQFGETRAVRMMRSRLCWFVKGCPRSSGFRKAIVRLETAREMADTAQAYFAWLKRDWLKNADPAESEFTVGL